MSLREVDPRNRDILIDDSGHYYMIRPIGNGIFVLHYADKDVRGGLRMVEPVTHYVIEAGVEVLRDVTITDADIIPYQHQVHVTPTRGGHSVHRVNHNSVPVGRAVDPHAGVVNLGGGRPQPARATNRVKTPNTVVRDKREKEKENKPSTPPPPEKLFVKMTSGRSESDHHSRAEESLGFSLDDISNASKSLRRAVRNITEHTEPVFSKDEIRIVDVVEEHLDLALTNEQNNILKSFDGVDMFDFMCKLKELSESSADWEEVSIPISQIRDLFNDVCSSHLGDEGYLFQSPDARPSCYLTLGVPFNDHLIDDLEKLKKGNGSDKAAIAISQRWLDIWESMLKDLIKLVVTTVDNEPDHHVLKFELKERHALVPMTFLQSGWEIWPNAKQYVCDGNEYTPILYNICSALMNGKNGKAVIKPAYIVFTCGTKLKVTYPIRNPENLFVVRKVGAMV